MRLRKILCTIITLFVISTASYAIEVSIGTSLGAGFPIFRGATYNAYSTSINTLYPNAEKLGYSLNMPTIDVMVEILPAFAIETGLGYRYSTWQNSYTNLGVNTIDSFTRSELYIPIMLRGQSKYGIGMTYVSAGIKMGFPLSSSYAVKKTYSSDEQFLVGVIDAAAAKFVLDASFAVGQEFKLAEVHYLGIRVSYDLNILNAFSLQEKNITAMFGEESEWRQDNLTFALTYRYAFSL